MECVLAKNGRNSSLHNGLKGYLEIATGDPKLVDNLALKGWLRGQSESLKAEYPNMPTDENNEAIVFYHNESVRSDSNNLTLDVAAVADKIDQWKPVFLKDSNSIVQADNPYFLGYVPNDNTIPVFEESIQKLIDRPVALATVPIKEGVPELFESNPELANSVYEALGFGQELNLQDTWINYVIKKDNISKEEALQRLETYRPKMITVYRGEGPTVNLENSNLPDHVKKNKGRWFTKDRKVAQQYAEMQKGNLYALQIPETLFDNISKELNLENTNGVEAILPQELVNEKVKLSYESTPQQKQQAQQIYSQYLDSIFPNSKVKDIVYHGSASRFDKFEDPRTSLHKVFDRDKDSAAGIFFDRDKNSAKDYGKYVHSALLNVKNSRKSTGTIFSQTDTSFGSFERPNYERYKNSAYDAQHIQPWIGNTPAEYWTNDAGLETSSQITVFEPEQVHILGSKQDIEGFKEFVTQPTTQSVKPGVSELFESNPKLANIGTPEQYSQYLDTVFPDSKVKDIVYHGITSRIKEKFDKFSKEFIKSGQGRYGENGFFFSENKEEVNKNYNNSGLISAVINLKNTNSDIYKNTWKETVEYLTEPQEIYGGKTDLDYLSEGYRAAAWYKEGNWKKQVEKLKEDGWKIEETDNSYIKLGKISSQEKTYYSHLKKNLEKGTLPFNINNSVEAIRKSKEQGLDGLVYENILEESSINKHNQYVVFEPEQIHILSSKSDIQGFREFVAPKQGVQELFDSNPELASIGTKEQYSQYLDTIFPDSKVKDIVYRGGNITKEEFENSEHTPTDYMDLGHGLYLSPNISFAKNYGTPRAVIVNIKNPKDRNVAEIERVEYGKTEGNYGIPQLDSNGKFDGIVDLSQDFNKTYELVVFEPEQIHILGGKQDIEGFKNFVNNQPSQPMYSRRNTGTATDEAALLTFARFLANKTGINFRLVTADEALRLNPNYNGEPGFFYNNVGYLVKGVANKSTALHEIFGHPMVELLEQQNLPLLHELFRAIPQSILDETKLAYPEHVLEDGTLDAIGMKEALIKAIEYEATNRLEAKDSTLKSLIDRLWMFISRLFNNTLDVKNLGRFTTIKEIADLAFNTSLLDTPLASNQVMYFKSTTQSETLQKFEAVFGHYSQARNADGVEVYTSSKNPSLVLKRLTEEVSRIFSNDIFGKSIDEWAANKATKYFQNPNAVFKDTDKSIETGSVQLATNKFYSYSELVDFYIRERNTNMRKGKLLHAIMEWILTMDTVAKDKILKGIIAMNDPEIVNGKIIADGIDTSMYDYLREVPDSENPTDEYELLKHITNVLRIRLNDPLAPDVLKNEYVLGNNELGIATRADTIVFHADGSYSIFDWQGGDLHSDNAFAKTAMSFFTQHGAKKQVVSKLNIKQMEITMRMFLIKLEIPEVKAKRAEVFEIQNLSNSTIRAIEGEYDIQDYLSAIERWIEAEHPELIEKYRALNVFDRDNYMTSGMHAYDYIKEATKVVGVDANEAAKNLTKRLIAVSSGIQNLEKEGKNLQGLKTLKDERSVLLKQWGDLQRTNILNVGIWNQTDDMEGGFLRLFNNRYDLSRYPQLQVIVDALSRAEYRALKRADDTRAEHNALLEDVIEDYKSIDPNIRTKIKIGLGNLKTFDYPIYKGDGTGFFDFAYIKKDFNGHIQLGWVTETDTEAWGKLTTAQRAYMNFINVEMRMAYKTAVIDTNITTLKRKRGSLEEVNVSKADLIGMSELGDNFMPYIPPLHEEYENRAMGVFGLLKDKLKNFSLYDVTEALNGKFSEHPGMPIRFLHASADIIEAEAHSLHVEHMFNTFVNQLYLVEELEEVVAVSKAFTEELEGMGKDENGDYNLINIIETMKDLTKMHATGRTTSGKETLKMGAMLGPENQIAAVNIDKAMAGLKTFTTYSSMLLSPVLAGANMATIALLNFKTAGVNSITSALSKQLGIKDDHVIDFTFTDMVNAHRDWAEIQALTVQHGADEKELNKNKMWQMLKAWRIFPDDYWFANSRNNDNVIKSTNLVTPETGMFLHLLGENYGVITTFAALVKKMEVQKGSIKKKVFDAYDVKDVATKSGKTIKKLVWNFGVRGVEVVKGTENDENKTTRLITELDSREIDYFKRAISKIHGDYRKSEKAIGEKHALFQWSLQFKKYLMRQLKNILDTKRYDSTLGHYDQVMDKDGKPVLIKVKDENGVETEESYMEWSARVTEGRYRTLINMIIEWLSLVDSPALQAWMKQKNLRLPVKGSYDWKNLSDDQKKNIVHVGMDLAFVLLGILGRLGFDEDDRNNKNPWYVQYIRLTENMSEGANPMDTFKAFKNSIPAIGRLTNIITYGSEFLFSVATGDRTQNGDLRGMNSLLNNLPLTNALRQVQRFDKQF